MSERDELAERDDIAQIIMGGLSNGVAEYIADALHAAGYRKPKAMEEAQADAWDEGHRFTGYEPERGENPYRKADHD